MHRDRRKGREPRILEGSEGVNYTFSFIENVIRDLICRHFFLQFLNNFNRQSKWFLNGFIIINRPIVGRFHWVPLPPSWHTLNKIIR